MAGFLVYTHIVKDNRASIIVRQAEESVDEMFVEEMSDDEDLF